MFFCSFVLEVVGVGLCINGSKSSDVRIIVVKIRKIDCYVIIFSSVLVRGVFII